MTKSPIAALVNQFRQSSGCFIKEENIMARPEKIRNPPGNRKSPMIFFIEVTFSDSIYSFWWLFRFISKKGERNRN